MAFPSPVGGRSPISSSPNPSPSKKEEGKKEIEQAVDQAAIDQLRKEPEAPKQSFFSGVWSMLWGEKEAGKPVSKEAGSELAVGDDSSPSSSRGEDPTEEELEFLELTGVKSENDISAVGKEGDKSQSGEASEKRKQLERSASKIERVAVKKYEPAPATMTARLGGWAVSRGASFIKWYAGKYDTDKDKAIAQQKQEMLNQLHDPQFVEFYELANRALVPKVMEKIGDAASQYIEPDVLGKLVEIILAHGFKNLASQVKENEKIIPNIGEQSSLVSIISLLSQKVGAHIDQAMLAGIEKKYQKNRVDLAAHMEKLFPGIDWEMEKSLQLYIKEYMKFATDAGRRNKIKSDLFPDFATATGQRADDIKAFFETLDVLRDKNRELNLIFMQVSDDILHSFFPNGLSGIPELKGKLTGGRLESWVSGYIQSTVSDLLQDTYESLENDTVRNEAWEEDLRTRLGVSDVNPIIEAPLSFLTAVTKNYIQSDPRFIDLTAWTLNGIMKAEGEQEAENSTPNQEKLLDQLAQKQLASWVVKSAQSMLHTTDPHLAGLGHFMTQAVNNLILALMAKGTKAVISEKNGVNSTAFVKEFTEGIVAKFRSLKGDEKIPDEFWQGFVKDLPIPTPLKDLLVPLLIENGESLRQKLKQKVNFEEIQKIQTESEERIRHYTGGEQLLSIIEKVSDQIIEQVLEKNIGLVNTDTLEEMFAQYLPGVKINDDLKNWFRLNISTLGAAEEGQSAQTTDLLKQGIRVVLQKAMVNTIEKNFKNNEKDYAAQLLKSFHQAFSKAFSGFDESKRLKLANALSIQTKIDDKNAHIKAIKTEIATKPTGITAKQMILLEEAISANARYIRASKYVASLEARRDEILTQLNQGYRQLAWTPENLPLVGEALILRKMESSHYASVNEYKHALQVQIDSDKDKSRLTEDKQKDLEKRQILLVLLDMKPDEIGKISEAINTNVTLQNAKKELSELIDELLEKEDAVESFDLGQSTNKKAWDDGKEWMKKVFLSRIEIDELVEGIASLEKELDGHLEAFQILSEELTGLLGLDEQVKLDLPPFLRDNVWTLIQSAKKQQIARSLFVYISPLVVSFTDLQKNKDRLNELSHGNPFLGQIIHAISEEAVSRIPEFVTSYKPFATQVLTVVGVANPTEEEVGRMEAALSQTLIALGKEGVTASMLKSLVKGLVSAKIVSPEKEDALSQNLEALIRNSKEISKEEVLELLKKEIPTTNKKEEQQLEKQARLLTNHIHQFLFNRGKINLKSQNLIDAYQSQVKGSQAAIPQAQLDRVLHDLESAHVVEKIKTVVITPEEIAKTLNDFIPGATDLHSLIAPQLQDVIVGADPTFKENREVLRQFLEGVVVRLFVKISENNQDGGRQDALTVITQKLKDLTNIKPKEGQTVEEAARAMIDQFLIDILGIAGEGDLDSIPVALRKITYDKIYEQAYQQVTPLILPIVEKNQSQVELRNHSGSNFLNYLCEALSKDVFALIPTSIKSYRTTAKEAYTFLSGKEPSAAELDQFTAEILTLVKQKNVEDHLIVQAFAKVSQQVLTPENAEKLRARLEASGVKETITSVIITPEEIAATVSEFAPHFDANIQKDLASEIQNFLANPEAYQNGSEFLRSYIEGVLLKVFADVAEKNPKQKGKDTLIVLTEKLLDVSAKKYQELREGKKTAEVVAKELNDAIMKDILGIDSPSAFKGLPGPLQAKVYEAVKDQIGTMFIKIHESISTLNSSNDQIQQAKEKTKELGVDKESHKGLVHVLAEDIANMVLASVPHAMTETVGGNMKGVTLVSKNVESYLEDLSRNNVELAKVLLTYTKSDQFKQMLGDNLAKLADQNQFVDDKKKAAELLTNLLVVPLGAVIEKAIHFENMHQQQFNQKLMANFLRVGAGQLKNLNEAKALAAKEGRTDIRHEDYIKAAGANLHPGVPKTDVNYQKTIDAIAERIYGKLSPEQQKATGKTYGKLTLEQEARWMQEKESVRKLIKAMVKAENQGEEIIQLDQFIAKFEVIHSRVMVGKSLISKPLTATQWRALQEPDAEEFTLRDLMRREYEELNVQRQEAAYAPAIKSMMKMIFPNGKKDLTFVPEEVRGNVWKIFEKNLFAQVLPMMTEVIFDPNTLNTMVLSSLETMRDSLKEPIVLGPKEPEGLPLDELDEVAGELMFESLRAVSLPSWAKNMMTDPKTGEITPAMKKTLGSTLRSQFNKTFIQDKLKIALETAVRREKGEFLLNFDTRPTAEKKDEAGKKSEKMQHDLKKVSREVVDVSISYFIRSKWAEFQARFDALVEKAFGKIGAKLKLGLDLVCRFIFFNKILKTIFSYLLSPIKQIIYRIISLDDNRDRILAMLTKTPIDQPEKESDYAIFYEDLVFKAGEALNKTIQEFLEKEPVVPMQVKDKG